MAILSDEALVDPLDQALAERETLIKLCMYALDRARSAGVAERLEEGMRAVGVTALRPDGETFDPARHEAGGTVGTGDRALDGVIAETEALGFTDRGRMLRAPVVVVYRLDGGDPHGVVGSRDAAEFRRQSGRGSASGGEASEDGTGFTA
ncbi:GrpE protein [Actinopolyspora xinjiangensis]|uniref:GrpE protein n=1 Tax=Actinopolyspora xinjiangensis TaxID=405564 RepID=A0A1H0VR18_9ACTN|nr:nucleotide exchange factor GrpE [Actinopolyspora xinjiangensis]SDP81032.1 GrpE protein [Actinopolyspora xinjiangensis]